MSKKKVPLTLEQHKELGKKLRTIKTELHEIHQSLHVAYGRKISDIVSQMSDKFELLISKLDDQVAEEHREFEQSEFNAIYYGWDAQKEVKLGKE